MVRRIKCTSKGCDSCGDGVTGFGQIVRRIWTKVWFLGQGNRDELYRQRVRFFWGWGNRVWSEGKRVLANVVVVR